MYTYFSRIFFMKTTLYYATIGLNLNISNFAESPFT
jgi:hypothetical protein